MAIWESDFYFLGYGKYKIPLRNVPGFVNNLVERIKSHGKSALYLFDDERKGKEVPVKVVKNGRRIIIKTVCYDDMSANLGDHIRSILDRTSLKPTVQVDMYGDKGTAEVTTLGRPNSVMDGCPRLLVPPEVIVDTIKEFSGHTGQESWHSRIESFFPNLEPKHLEVIIANDALTPLKGGYSSGIVLSSPNIVVKQASKGWCKDEERVYGWNLGEVELHMPHLLEQIELENSGLLVMTNFNSEVSGFVRSGFLPFNPDGSFNLDKYIKHNLHLQGLWHKNATRAAIQTGFKKGLTYGTSDGTPHYEAIGIPLSHYKGLEQDFIADIPAGLIDRVRPIVKHACNYLRETPRTVVHYDWKPGEDGNLPNGGIVDFHTVQWLVELQDNLYFLSHKSLGLAEEQIDHYIRWYIQDRSSHDKLFESQTDVHREMYRWRDSIRMFDLSILAGVMGKRPLWQDGHMETRRFYLGQMRELLGKGNFI